MRILFFFILLLTMASAHSQESFLKVCRNKNIKDDEIKRSIQWLKLFHKTEDCTVIAKNLSKMKSLSEMVPPSNKNNDIIESPWTDQFPHLYGLQNPKYAPQLEKIALQMDVKGLFKDLKMFKDFKNIIDMSYESSYSYSYEDKACNLLKLFPNLKTLTLEEYQLGPEEDECLSKSKLEGIIIRGGFNLYKNIPKSKIIGIENYKGEFAKLIKFPHLKYLGISNASDSQGSMNELTQQINITHFSMSSNNGNKISDLGIFPNLNFLSLTCFDGIEIESQHCSQDSFLSDINFISELVWLRHLKLNYHNLTDIGPLSKLTRLETLELKGNRLNVFPELENLSTLSFLDLGGNDLVNIDNIILVKNLKTLDLSANSISNFSPLKKLSQLRELNLSNNPFQDSFSSFNPPDSLRVLSLNGVGNVEDGLDQDNYMTSYEEEFIENEASDHLGLTYKIMKNDFELSPDKQIFKPFISPNAIFSNLKNIEILSMRNNGFKQIPDLTELSHLKYLDLGSNEIEELNATGSISLRVLDLSKNKFKKIPQTSQFPELKKMDLIGNKIETVDDFKNPLQIESLALGGNLIKDVAKLANPDFNHIRYELEYNPIPEDEAACPLQTENKDLKWYCDRLINHTLSGEELN